MGTQQPKDYSSLMRNAAPYMDLGLRFALAAALGGVGGHWLDTRLHTHPWGLILGIMLGGTAGFINLYRTVMRLTDEETRRKKEQS